MLILQLIIDGFGKGAVYAALALAIVVGYRSTGLINFAQGEIATLSAMFTVVLTGFGLNVWVALLIAVAVSFIGGAAAQFVFVRPILKRAHLVQLLMTIGLYVVASAIGEITFGPTPKPLAPLFPDGSLNVGGLRIAYALIGVILLQVVVITGLNLFFGRTKLGLAFRAVATAPEASRIVGIRVGRMHMVGWGLAAALGAVSSVSLTNLNVYVQPSMMITVLVYSLAAVTIGGYDSAVGAILGGVLIGVVETLVTSLVPGFTAEGGTIVALVVIVAVMLFRPQGLFGRERVARA
jgi:branched-chain amino acid transport system permease protein